MDGLTSNLQTQINGKIDSNNVWKLSGNGGTNASLNFLGTTDAQPLVFKTNNNTGMTLGTSGSITMNTLAGATNAATTTANEGANRYYEDFSNLDNGYYLLEISNGSISSVQRFMIER